LRGLLERLLPVVVGDVASEFYRDRKVPLPGATTFNTPPATTLAAFQYFLTKLHFPKKAKCEGPLRHPV